MDAIRAVVQGGRLEVRVPGDWPDGTEVIVRPVARAEGLREEDGQDPPEAVAAWLAWYDSLEPLEFTDEERTAWAADRAARKARERAAFAERAEKLGRIWP